MAKQARAVGLRRLLLRTQPRLPLLGAVAAVGLALALTWQPVFDPAVQALYATNPDAVEIVAGAEQAAEHGLWRWWTGHWIQASSHYYRPLSSTVMWAQWRLWGRDFQNYCVVSWLSHALLCLLLYSLGYRLLQARGPAIAAGGALLAVALFNLRRGVVGPGWIPERATADGLEVPMRIAQAQMPYWPGQTDLFSLLFTLASLLALDRYLEQGRRGWLAAALGLFAVALLFKEMAVAAVLIVPLLLWYRRRWSWPAVGGCAALGAALLVVRQVAVPEATNPSFPSLAGFLLQVTWYLHFRLLMTVGAGMSWVLPAAAGMLALIYAGRRWRLSIVYVVPGLLVWPVLMAAAWGGNPALITLPEQLSNLGHALLALGGLAVLARSRDRLPWMLAGILVAVHLPILHLKGPHYLYWPAACWGLLGAALWVAAGEQWKKLGRRAAAAPE